MNKQLSRFKHSEGLIMLKAKVIITFIHSLITVAVS